MKKLFLSAALSLMLVLSFGVASTHAAVTPVNGYAWSSNIGWIKFDTGQPNPVTVETSTGNMAGSVSIQIVVVLRLTLRSRQGTSQVGSRRFLLTVTVGMVA